VTYRHIYTAGAAIAGALIALAGCATVQTTEAGAVGIERKQTMLVSSEEINAAAKQSYQKILQDARSKGTLNRDPVAVRRVRAVADRLIPVTSAFRPDAPGWKWEVNVITTNELNAWCMPGGKIAVYTGLLDTLKLTDDELAAVMGHEIAHALREHGRERASQAMATSMAVGVIGAVAGLGQSGTDLVQMVADLTFTLPNSRLHETEADRIGIELAARAGYDPRAAIGLWQKMLRAAGGDQPPAWLSTHPSHENRIRDIEVYSQRVMPLYEQSRKRGDSGTILRAHAHSSVQSSPQPSLAPGG